MRKITLIPGDGIGPEIVSATLQVLEASGARIKFEEILAGQSAMDSGNSPLSEELIQSIKKNKVALKGP